MSNLASSCESLYQEFFTGKGSLLFELVSSVKGEGEGWELFEKKGKLFLKGDSHTALIYALSFLRNLPAETALTFMGKVTPRYSTRALLVEERIELSPQNIKHILELGFNTLVGDYEPVEGLKILPLTKLPKKLKVPKDETLLDVQILELAKAEIINRPFIFYTEDPHSIEELNFQSVNAILSFQGDEIWEILSKANPFGTKLLPSIKCPSPSKLPLLIQNELSQKLGEMKRHPFEGFMVTASSLPERGSFEEANLFTAGFCQILSLDPRLLTKYWFKKNNLSQWNEEAITHFDNLARFKMRDGIKEDRQKIMADIAYIETRWPNTIYAAKAATLKPH